MDHYDNDEEPNNEQRIIQTGNVTLNSSVSSLRDVGLTDISDVDTLNRNISNDSPKGIRILSWNINSVMSHREQLLLILNT